KRPLRRQHVADVLNDVGSTHALSYLRVHFTIVFSMFERTRKNPPSVGGGCRVTTVRFRPAQAGAPPLPGAGTRMPPPPYTEGGTDAAAKQGGRQGTRRATRCRGRHARKHANTHARTRKHAHTQARKHASAWGGRRRGRHNVGRTGAAARRRACFAGA